MTHILIVEDDSEICQLYSRVLTKNGYQVTGVANGQMALDAIDQNYYDLIISDIMMPVMNGYELVRELRENGCNIPVMMITAKDAFDDKRQGFLSGTDDYMVKPIDVDEMVLRVGALLRRSKIINDRSLTIGGTVMDMDAFSVTADGETQTLPQKEFMLLYKLASYPGKIFTRMLYRQRKESIERVFADAKEKHAMRYTHHRGLAAVTRWVRLKYAAMNLKKLANWSWKNSFFYLSASIFHISMTKPLFS